MGLNLEDVCVREVCGSYRHEERGVRSLPRGWCHWAQSWQYLLTPPSYSIMSKFPPDLEGNATDPRAHSLAGLDLLPIVYPPVITEAL